MKFFAIAAVALSSFAQDAPLSLKDAVRQASERYPSIRVSREQIAESSASVELARTAFLPRVDAIAQVNRATTNNVFGLLFPNSVISPIS